LAPTLAANTAPTVQPNPTEVQAAPTPVQVALPVDLAAAIVQGYSNYWTVRIAAMRDPTDTTIQLDSVMAGDELQGAYKTLTQYRDVGEAFNTTVRHQIWITSATNDEAVIVDRYIGSTTRLDPVTQTSLGSEPIIQNFSDRFVLQKIDGAWKVVGESPEGS
jgi:hypothetical protein